MTSFYSETLKMNFGFINYNSIYIRLKNVRHFFSLYSEPERKWSKSRMCLIELDLAKTLCFCRAPELTDDQKSLL